MNKQKNCPIIHWSAYLKQDKKLHHNKVFHFLISTIFTPFHLTLLEIEALNFLQNWKHWPWISKQRLIMTLDLIEFQADNKAKYISRNFISIIS